MEVIHMILIAKLLKRLNAIIAHGKEATPSAAAAVVVQKNL